MRVAGASPGRCSVAGPEVADHDGNHGHPTVGRNQEEELDDPTFYWYLATLATVGGFLFGYDTSNIGSALVFIPYHLSSPCQSAPRRRCVSRSRGRRSHGGAAHRPVRPQVAADVDSALFAVGSLLSAFSFNAVTLLGRSVIGVAIGADSAIATAYISEFAPRDDAASSPSSSSG